MESSSSEPAFPLPGAQQDSLDEVSEGARYGRKGRPPTREQAKAIYPEFSVAREPATTVCLWQRLPGRQRSRKLSSEKEKDPGVP